MRTREDEQDMSDLAETGEELGVRVYAWVEATHRELRLTVYRCRRQRRREREEDHLRGSRNSSSSCNSLP